MRTPILAAAIAVLSAGHAHAQVADITTGRPESSYYGWTAFPLYENSRVPEQVGREVEIERNYREAVKKIPDKKPSNDPWKSVRPAPAAATTAFDRHRAQ